MESQQANGNNKALFVCSRCNFSMLCQFSTLAFEKNRYVGDEYYYIRDPFELQNVHKSKNEYSIDDSVVIGANCNVCSQPVCIDEECSIFYKHQYCNSCILREKEFPRELLLNAMKETTTRHEKRELQH